MKRLVILALALAAATGCSSRALLSVQDGPGAAGSRTTILKTLDTKYYVVYGTAKFVFWECREEGGGLVCEKRCDVKDDQGDMVRCQQIQSFWATM